MNGVPAAGAADATAPCRPRVTQEIVAEAAVWIARLHGPSRTRQLEQEFLIWLAFSPAHREAFERCTDAWEDIPRIGLAAAYERADAHVAPARARTSCFNALWRWTAASAVACVVAVGAVFMLNWRGENAYSTKIGEQRLVVLQDGSRMLLNTDTQLRVDFSTAQRTVEVRGGEAYFEVAKDVHRPFVVRIAGSEVVAVGTAFSVRYVPTANAVDELVVTLVEGQIKVRPTRDKARNALAPAQPMLMKAGERLLIDRTRRNVPVAAVARLEQPGVERALAWKRSEVVFDDTSLADAVAEMNRYNRTPIVLLDGLSSSELRISGLYRTDDSAGFAGAIAALHGLHLRETSARLELAKPGN